MKEQRGSRKANPMNSRRREICGTLLFCFAAFSIVSLYVQTAGIIGYQLRSWFQLLFGQMAVLFVLILLIFSIQVFKGIFWPIKWKRHIGWSLMVITGITLYHFLEVYQGYQLPPSLVEELQHARIGLGAGWLGALSMVIFLSAFGLPGTYIILSGLFLTGLLLAFDISLLALINAFVGFLIGLWQNGWQSVVDSINGQRAAFTQWQEKRKLVQIENTIDAKTAKKQVKQKQPKKQKSEVVYEPVEEIFVDPWPEDDDYPDDVDEAAVSNDEDTHVIETPQPTNVSKMGALPEASSTMEGSLAVVDTAIVQNYRLPPIYLLKKASLKSKRGGGESKQRLLEDTFTSFGISAKVVNICQGPVVTRYELQLAPGIKVSKITALADDLALALAAADVRIEAPVPGKSVIGIEVPNKVTQPVLLRDVIEHPAFAENSSKVTLALGKDIAGNPVIADLKKWLHLLVAGSTGSGKSVCLNSIIASILYNADPNEVKLLMIDPKRVELAIYDGIPHLISPVVTDPKKAAIALRWAVVEMERRYKLFSDTAVRNIDMYSALPKEDADGKEREHLPFIVIIVDELADLMMVAANDVEEAICRIAQMARAAGMYLVIATQRPSVDVITGLIKANVPSRISFAVSSQVDSRTILDMAGAERLIGKGDMLFYPIGASKPSRAQGAWISDSEVEALVRFWKKQGEPEYTEQVMTPTVEVSPEANQEEDTLLEDAIQLVIENGQASISMLQRRFRIGYARAARLIDMMEVKSIVGPYQGSKAREVLVDNVSIER